MLLFIFGFVFQIYMYGVNSVLEAEKIQRLQQSIAYVQCIPIIIIQIQKWRTELLPLLTMNVNRIVSASTKLLLL